MQRATREGWLGRLAWAKRARALLRQINRDDDRKLAIEAIQCLRAGALRSAYIMIWVSVTESLKSTLKEMAVRDNEIQKIVGKIERLEGDERSVDRLLLDESTRLGIVPAELEKQLRHLYDMRSLYAHPYNSAPSADDVRAAFRVAVEGVLSRKPFFRHGYIAQRLDLLFDRRDFLDDDEDKVQAYGRDLADRIDPSLQIYFTERLLGRLEPVANDPDLGMFSRRGANILTAFLLRIDAQLGDADWHCVGLLERWKKSSSGVFRQPDLWMRLNSQAQDMVVSLELFPESQTSPSIQALEYFWAHRDMLKAEHLEKLREALELAELAELAQSSLPVGQWSFRLIGDLKSHNWYVQNPAIGALLAAGPERLRTECSEENQEELGRNVLQTAEGGSRDAVSFLRSLASAGDRWPTFFLRGLLLEAFVNEENELRFKLKRMATAVLGSLRNAGEDQKELAADLASRIGIASPKAPVLYTWEVQEAIEAIDAVLPELSEGENDVRASVMMLRSAVQAVPAEEPPPAPF